MKHGFILMLERDAVDREITLNHFLSMREDVEIKFLTFSNEVIPFLTEIVLESKPLPQLVILSMNSIPENALLVVKELKSKPGLKHIPVIILGEDTDQRLIKECYYAGTNSFINKPFTNEETGAKICSFINYWLDVSEPADYSEAEKIA